MEKTKIVLVVCATTILTFATTAYVLAQTFDHDLYFGIQSDSDVTKLQEFLTSEGVYSGPITGNFFSLTLAGVKNFQSREGITPVAGYFGPLTRAAANAMIGNDITASNNQAVSETGNLPATPASSSVQLQLEALLKTVALLQAQLQTQQSSTQAVQNLQTQVQQQTQTIQQQAQTLQQIQQNTQQIQQNTQQNPTPAPTPYVFQMSTQRLAVYASSLNGANHTATTSDDIGTITFTASSSGNVLFHTLVITFGGNAVIPSFLTTANISLIDQNGNPAMATEKINPVYDNYKQIAWYFPYFGAGDSQGLYIATAGSHTFTLRVNSAAMPVFVGMPTSFSASLVGGTYSTADGTFGLISSDKGECSIPINSIIYPWNPVSGNSNPTSASSTATSTQSTSSSTATSTSQ